MKAKTIIVILWLFCQCWPSLFFESTYAGEDDKEEHCLLTADDVLQEKFKYILIFSKEDFELLLTESDIIQSAFSEILKAKSNQEDISLAITNTDEIQEARNACYRLIREIKNPIIIPYKPFPAFPYQTLSSFKKEKTLSDNSCERWIEELTYISVANNHQYLKLRGVLWNDLEVLHAQKNYNGVIKNLRLNLLLAQSIHLCGTESCTVFFGTLSDIIKFVFRIYDDCSLELKGELDEILRKTSEMLELLPKKLIEGAQNEAMLALPRFIEADNDAGSKEMMELLLYYNDLSKNETQFFDLNTGPLYNTEEDLKKHVREDNIIDAIKLSKILIQGYRDQCHLRYKRIANHFLKHDVPVGQQSKEK